MPRLTPRLLPLPLALALSLCCAAWAQAPWDDADIAALLPKAERGDIQAMVELADRYRFIGSEELSVEGWERAAPWYEKAAMKGNEQAAIHLSWHYREPVSGEPDLAKAFYWMEHAAKANNASAQLELGDMLEHGIGTKVDAVQAVKWYEKAAAANDRELQLRLGLAYSEGAGVAADTVRAAYWLNQAAFDLEEAGYALANLREADPTLVEKVLVYAPEETKVILAKATAGNASAQKQMAELFRRGMDGVFEDHHIANTWLERAATAGDAEAQHLLGRAYFDGQGVEKNNTQAKAWLSKAIAQHYPATYLTLGDIALEEAVPKSNDAAAFGLWKKGAELGNPECMMRLADMLQARGRAGQGFGDALHWYTKLAEKGDYVAMHRLAELAMSNDTTVRDFALAKKWLLQMKNNGDDSAESRLSYLAELEDAETKQPHVAAGPLAQGKFEEGLLAYQEKKYKEALDLWEGAAGAGLGGAMFNLAVMHERAEGVERDVIRALDWYEKAGAAGVEEGVIAAKRLVPMVFLQRGDNAVVASHHAEAIAAFEQAAALGSVEGMMRLGSLYAQGKGIAQDYEKSAKWYEKAGAVGWEPGTRYAKLSRANLLGQVALKEARAAIDVMELEEGAEGLEEAARLGNPAAMMEFATMLKEGDGIPRDVESAKKWFKQAAELGDVGAALELQTLESSGSLYALMDSQREMRRLRNSLNGVANQDYGQNLKGPKTGVKNLRKHQRWSQAEIVQALKDGANHEYLAAVLRRDKIGGMTELDVKRLMRTPEGKRIDPFGKLRTVLGEHAVSSAGEWAYLLAEEKVARRRAALGPVTTAEDTHDLRAKANAGDVAAMITLLGMRPEHLKHGPLPEWDGATLAENVRAQKYVPGYWLLADTLRNNVDATKDEPVARAQFLYAAAEAGEPKAMKELAFCLSSPNYAGVARNLAEAEYWLIEAAARSQTHGLEEFDNPQRDVSFLYAFGVPLGGTTMHPMSHPDVPVLRWARELIRRGGDVAEVAEISLDSMEQEGQHKNLRATMNALPAEVPLWSVEELFRLESGANRGDPEAAYSLGEAYASGRGIRQHDFKSIQFYEIAAAKGHAPSSRALANAAKDGFGLKKDAGVRLAWLEKAGNAGDAVAWREAGDMLHYSSNENTLPSDYPRAMAAYEKAAAAGDGMAMHSLGLMYEYERGVPKNPEKAMAWQRRGAEAGNMHAQHHYARKLMAASKFADAAVWYGKAVDNGLPALRVNQAQALLKAGDSAQARIAFEKVVLEDAYNFEAEMAIGALDEAAENYTQAKTIYQAVAANSSLRNVYRAQAEARVAALNDILSPKVDPTLALKTKAEAGDAKAMLAYAQAIAKDRKAEAIEWVRKAATSGDSQAMLVLGLELASTSKADGIEWMTRSASAGNPEAKYRIGVAMFLGKEMTKDVPSAVRHLTEAAQAGYALAQLDLGRSMMVSTPGVPIDVAQGSMYVRQAGDQGLPAAAALLGEMYERGVGVPASPQYALVWYRKALSAGLQQVKPAIERLEIQLKEKTPSPAK